MKNLPKNFKATLNIYLCAELCNVFMFFNSVEFALFLPVVFVLYWFVSSRNLKVQNALLIVASYFFYGWWDWRFLFLIAFSSAIDFFVGVGLTKDLPNRKRKLLLLISIVINLGLLGVFKYYNFFAESFANAFTFLGKSISPQRMNIILPVGISFYTFQTLSYSIDVYRRKLEATKDPLSFFAYVSFFPQLVAGPIERATNLLPQFYKKRVFDNLQASNGMRQILWGLFKKIVIADNCAGLVNDIFAHQTTYTGSTLLIGSVLFAFQIYGDFSGYSDIAIGTSRLFGFTLKQNFAYPYFSRDIAEFWRRWHISLSTWFRDYVYIPLGGSRVGKAKAIRNTLIIFVVSGFWHGANWTFVFWGFLNAIYFIPLLLLKKNRKNTDVVASNTFLPSAKEFIQILITFTLTCLAWVFFRSTTLLEAFDYIGRIFSKSLFQKPIHIPFSVTISIVFLVIVEYVQRKKLHALQFDGNVVLKPLRWSYYMVIVLAIYLLGNFNSGYEFIYFQF